MATKAVISSIDFKDFLSTYEVINSLDFSSQASKLDMAMILQKDSFTLVFKDSLSYATLTIPAIITSDFTTCGVGLEHSKFFNLITSYTIEELASMKIEVTEAEDTSSFVITVADDTLLFPHVFVSPERMKEYESFTLQESLFASSAFSFKENEEQSNDIVQGILTCLSFLSKDEKKNNALALYKDKIIVNDNRHIFIYKFNKGISLHQPLCTLHKKSAKLFSLLKKAKEMLFEEFTVSLDMNKVFIKSKGLFCEINNSLSNIAPPSEADLASIRPDSLPIALSTKVLSQTASFFDGFYPSTMEWNPLYLQHEENSKDLSFILRDEGVSGIHSSNITRKVSMEQEYVDAFEATVINNSLLTFFSKLDEKSIPTVDLYIKDTKPAVFISTVKADLYLAKFKR